MASSFSFALVASNCNLWLLSPKWLPSVWASSQKHPENRIVLSETKLNECRFRLSCLPSLKGHIPFGLCYLQTVLFFVSEFLIVISREIGYSSKFFHHKYRLGCKTSPTNYTITHFFGTQHFKPSSLPSALDDLKFTLAEKKSLPIFWKTCICLGCCLPENWNHLTVDSYKKNKLIVLVVLSLEKIHKFVDPITLACSGLCRALWQCLRKW